MLTVRKMSKNRKNPANIYLFFVIRQAIQTGKEKKISGSRDLKKKKIKTIKRPVSCSICWYVGHKTQTETFVLVMAYSCGRAGKVLYSDVGLAQYCYNFLASA